MSLWLIRTHKNELLGPVTRDELLEQIRQGKLTTDDEVCATNHYWIHLDERDEVSAQLGIEMPRQKRVRADGEEITLTDTAEIVLPHHAALSQASPQAAITGTMSDAMSPTMSMTPGAASSSSPRQYSGTASPNGATAVSGPPPLASSGPSSVVGRPETALLLRIGTFLLVFITSGFVFWILKILREASAPPR